MLVVVGIIHLLPLSGALGADRLGQLYGLAFTDANLVVLMRHRAILFGVLGAFLIFAAFRPALQPAALIAGLVSVVSFIWLAWPRDAHNANIATVFNVDLFALACLVLAAIAWAIDSSRSA
jgi:nitrate reductase gamma subunit